MFQKKKKELKQQHKVGKTPTPTHSASNISHNVNNDAITELHKLILKMEIYRQKEYASFPFQFC